MRRQTYTRLQKRVSGVGFLAFLQGFGVLLTVPLNFCRNCADEGLRDFLVLRRS